MRACWGWIVAAFFAVIGIVSAILSKGRQKAAAKIVDAVGKARIASEKRAAALEVRQAEEAQKRAIAAAQKVLEESINADTTSLADYLNTKRGL